MHTQTRFFNRSGPGLHDLYEKSTFPCNSRPQITPHYPSEFFRGLPGASCASARGRVHGHIAQRGDGHPVIGYPNLENWMNLLCMYMGLYSSRRFWSDLTVPWIWPILLYNLCKRETVVWNLKRNCSFWQKSAYLQFKAKYAQVFQVFCCPQLQNMYTGAFNH
jgi:hypothetical protein